MKGDVRFVLAVLFVGALFAACTRSHFVDHPDIHLPVPTEEELARWVEGAEGPEAWRKDPCRVADQAIRRELRPSWQYQPYRAEDYTFIREHAGWGAHVTRGYATRNIHRRYRVKVRPWRGIWYATEVSHYHEVVFDHPALGE